MLEVAWQQLRRTPGLLAALVLAIALPVLLVLVTSSVYLGLLEAMVAFPRTLAGDLVVTEAGGSPIFMRSTSRLEHEVAAQLRAVPGVASVAPIYGRLVWVEREGRRGLVFLVGLYPDETFGAPAQNLAGKSRPGLGDILVDHVLAHDLGLQLGTRVGVGGARLRVAGITAGGNAVLGTYAFVNRNALVFAGTSTPSHVFVRLADGAPAADVRRRIVRLGGLQVYSQAQFVLENQSLARQFYRPLIGIIAGICALVGAVVLALALWVVTIERREDYALLRALGFSRRRVYAVVLWQAALVSAIGVVVGLAGGLGAAPGIERLEPRFVTSIPWWLAALVGMGAFVVGLAAVWQPARAVTRIDPALVFRV